MPPTLLHLSLYRPHFLSNFTTLKTSFQLFNRYRSRDQTHPLPISRIPDWKSIVEHGRRTTKRWPPTKLHDEGLHRQPSPKWYACTLTFWTLSFHCKDLPCLDLDPPSDAVFLFVWRLVDPGPLSADLEYLQSKRRMSRITSTRMAPERLSI